MIPLPHLFLFPLLYLKTPILVSFPSSNTYINDLNELSFTPLNLVILYADYILLFKPTTYSSDMFSFQSDLDTIFCGFLLTFSLSIHQCLTTLSLLTNHIFILSHSLLSLSHAHACIDLERSRKRPPCVID